MTNCSLPPPPKPSMRVALYARFSSDLQRQTSIDDQLRAARGRAAAEGWHVVIERSDQAVSGATPFLLRPGSKALLADALAGRFDVLIVEGLDRTFRDVGEQEQIVKRLEHRGIRIIGTSDGYDTLAKGRKVMRIARGLVNELYLDDLAQKTHRGLAGQFDRGLTTGGKSYGYRSEETPAGRQLVIDQTEADHVRWIFDRYAEGWTPVSIAHELNRRGVPSPRGGSWAVGAIHGSAARGLGLLNNVMYSGQVIWNRRQWLKDPETGARVYTERPREEWQFRDAPHLRIIDPATWAATRQRMAQIAERGANVAKANKGGRPARTLFGGLLRCPTCGGPVIAVSSRAYGCGVHKDRGSAICTNDATTPRTAVDARLLALVREDLESPQSFAELQQNVRQLVAEHQREASGAAHDGKRRLAEVEKELGRLVDALAQVGYSPAIAERLRSAEAERAALAAQTAEVLDVDELTNVVLADYRAAMLDLKSRLDGHPDRERTRELLRQMLGPVTLARDADGVTWAQMNNPAEQLLVAGGMSLTVVAGAGFEPTTFGL
jgi:site-specific DNA recombinase